MWSFWPSCDPGLDERTLSLERISNRVWRADLISRQGYASGQANSNSLCATLDRLSYVQLDSIKTVERSHHCILHSRLKSYRPDMLDDLVKQRQVFENWTHDACVLPMALFPLIRLRFHREAERLVTANWWKGGNEEIRSYRSLIRDALETEGPKPLKYFTDLTGSKPATKGAWQWSGIKIAMEYMWRTGEVAVCHRQNFNKVYDLTERIVPAALFGQHVSEVDAIAQLVDKAVKALGFGTAREICDFWGFLKIKETQSWIDILVDQGLLRRIERECYDGNFEVCYASSEPMEDAKVGLVILNPFDPLTRNRNRLSRMFGFEYRFEAYVPKAKRRFGYYVFPILENDRLIGRIDMALDKSQPKSNPTLKVTGFWPEAGVRDTKTRRNQIEKAVTGYQTLSQAQHLSFDQGWWR